MRKLRKTPGINSLDVRRMCVLPLTEVLWFGITLEGLSCWLPRSRAEVSGGEEVSETGSVSVSSLLTQRSEISIEHSFYRVRYP